MIILFLKGIFLPYFLTFHFILACNGYSAKCCSYGLSDFSSTFINTILEEKHNLRSMFIFHPSEVSTSFEGGWRSGFPCLLVVSDLPLSARHLNILSESFNTGVNVKTLVVTFPSGLVC